MRIVPNIDVPKEVKKHIEHQHLSNGGYLPTNEAKYYPKGMDKGKVIVYHQLENRKFIITDTYNENG